jgi:sugar phosphate isomerase/epimerase
VKLGVAGLLPAWQAIDVDAARRVRYAGFRGASIFFERPLEADLDDVRRLKRNLDAAELEAAQANGWYEALIHPEEAARAEGVRGLERLVQIGRMVDAETVYVRPGSYNPRGPWYPHPRNHAPATFGVLVDSLRRVCRTAKQEGMVLAVEGHVLSPLDSPRRVADLLDAVGSPHLKSNTDPVNFIGTVRDAHDTRPVLEHLFDLLGDATVVAHCKDLRLRDELVLHIEECPLGAGTLDYPVFLRRFQPCCPRGYLIIEHLRDEQVPAAREALLRFAEREGIVLDCCCQTAVHRCP